MLPSSDARDAERPRDGADIDGLAPEREGRRARRHLQRVDLRQRVQQLFGQAVAEMLVVGVGAHVGERQHRERRDRARRGHRAAHRRLRWRIGGPARVRRRPAGAAAERLFRAGEVVEQRGRRRISVRALLLQRPADDIGHGLRHACQRRRIARQDGDDHVRGGAASERRRARQQLVQHRAKAEEVGLLVNLQPARLLGRHVLRRADEHAAGGLPGRRSRRRDIRVGGPREARNAEVEQLDEPVLPDHHVVGLEVAMDDAGAVSLGQRRRHLDADVDHRRDVELGASGGVAERPAVHELAGDEVRARRVADVVDRDDVRVVQRRRGPGFADEPGQAVPVAGRCGRQDLQRDPPAEADVLGEIHLPHPALAEEREDFVVPESCAWIQPHEIRSVTGSPAIAVMGHSRTPAALRR